MKKKLLQMLNLRLLIIAFAFLTLLTLFNSFYSAWRVQKQVLIENELSENQAYAERIASTIDLYLAVSWSVWNTVRASSVSISMIRTSSLVK